MSVRTYGRRGRCALILGATLALALAGPALATDPDGPAHPPLPSHDTLVDGLIDGTFDLDQVRAMGLSVFSTPFNTHDGFGDGPFDPTEYDDPNGNDTLVFGHRPTLQGNGTLLRVNGLDAQSCNECHTIVSNATRPPELGLGGVGGMVQNAIIMPSLIDVADSFDDRVFFQSGHDPSLPLEFDGVADYNGRFANPPFLFGGGGVEALAKEMTADLQHLLQRARRRPPGTITRLVTHGVDFGHIVSLRGRNVRLEVEGLGPSAGSYGGVPPEEVLVVRPFGRKGENFSMRDFDRGAMQFHFGIQPVEVVGAGIDEDRDGLADEVTVGEMTALHIFDVTNPRPFQDPPTAQTQQGAAVFAQVGCADCHRRFLDTESRWLPLAFPEVADDPDEHVYLEVDLVSVGFDPAPGGGVRVPLFSDLKRHDMGPRLAETFERGEIANEDFITARLWGIADTAPYLHDGRATTLYEAIEFHGGEAQSARDGFLALSAADQEALIAFLNTLRTPVNANLDLVPLIP